MLFSDSRRKARALYCTSARRTKPNFAQQLAVSTVTVKTANPIQTHSISSSRSASPAAMMSIIAPSSQVTKRFTPMLRTLRTMAAQ